MASWKDDFLAALEARDAVEKANLGFYEAYTRLADRTASLSQKQTTEESEIEATGSPGPNTAGKRGPKIASSPPTESLTQLRDDLSSAQQERAELQSRLDAVTKELEALKSKSKIDSKRITQLSAGVTQLTVRLRDRDEELREKSKLVENVQDEMVSLNLQLNMAEEQAEKLKKENKELIDRWMAKKNKEAEAMNDESNFH